MLIRSKEEIIKWFCVLPSVLLFIIFFFYPLGMLLVDSLIDGSAVSLENYVQIFTRARYLKAFFNSVFLSLAVTSATIIIAGFISFFLARNEFWGKRALMSLITFPASLPGVVVGFMIIILFGTTGVIPMLTRLLFGMEIGVIAYKISGIFVAYLYFSIPKTVLLMYGSLVEFDQRLEEAARTLGATENQAIMKVFIPTLMPVFVSATSITFSISMSAFGTAFTLANQFEILPILMYTEYTNYFDIGSASALAILIAVISLALNSLAHFVLEKE